ncbi:Predicted protein [Taphrina deformans PYCC 5710]|uniref:Pentatricopeptide repeat protein n=1 Tax=Taphrina deformans (strain PYCC 5710 / ATCC 11124 / CBS 356.35 / IMI 108563 / JCM 9778 / NBRC 8474) TaxID=1097556 RepID=R4XCG5_TAPDE|nr:Predicted protein [Taphrina deformans PYCC 5710]|eukprot:CCG83286.1 Predicted protein [Taphrina deformans PYCC 5710]
MLRYSEVINEMTAQAPPLVPTAAEWTALISFVGRLHKNPSASDVNNCLQIWDEMEGTYAVKADLVTFNVLLDISIKARRWQTVDSLLKEMKSRALHHDRYTWTTLLYGAGLRRDGSEVRRLSRAMLESGEVLDILVINAIISALFRCDESAEAEHLFEHVNRTTIKTAEASSLNHLFDEGVNSSESQRTSLFQQRARMNRAHLRNGETLTHEDTSPRFAFRTPDYLAPDIRTFNMVLGHHCRETGNFARVGELLEAMERRKIPDSIAMFRSLFCGFRCFGRRGKEWKLEKLHYVFQTLLGASEVRLTRELTLEAIQAFAAVGTRDDVEECWQALDEAWQGQGGSPLKRSSRVVRERELALRAAEGIGSTGQTVSRFSKVPVHDRPTVEVDEVPA